MTSATETKIFFLADDDGDDTELFREALTVVDENIICHCVGNGKEVLELLKRSDRPPHLIFLDVNMPVMNGWQCLVKLKDDSAYRDIPVIMYSTSSYQREKIIASELGALGFITKPSDYRELKRILQIIAESPVSDLKKSIDRL